jgi:hypothetical protein
MNKKKRKELEEKIAFSIAETIKLQGLKSSAIFLKSVKKHSKTLAKKLLKDLTPPPTKKALPASIAKPIKSAAKSIQQKRITPIKKK